MNGQTGHVNLNNTIHRELVEKFIDKSCERHGSMRSGISKHRPEMAHVQDQAAGSLFTDDPEKLWDGHCPCDKVGEWRHFKQDQRRASIGQTTLLIEQMLDQSCIISHHLRA